jgi:hypothetical protein
MRFHSMTRDNKSSDNRSRALWALPCLTVFLGAMGCDAGGATAPSGGIVPPKGPANMSLIDSLEDGDGWIDEVSGRAGPWYTYNDGTADGTQYPHSGDPYGADFGSDTHKTDYGVSVAFARSSGTGFTDWGAGFGFDLAHPDTAGKSAYNAGGYTGLRLWIRTAGGADSITSMTVKILDSQSVASGEGGVCVEGTQNPDATHTRCGDAFSYSIQLQASGSVTADRDFSVWQGGDIKWADFKQAGWGQQAKTGVLDTTALLAIHFQFDSPAGRAFDVSIDDISFTTADSDANNAMPPFHAP